MSKEKLTERIEIRVTPYEKNFIKGLANIYSNGNISALLVHSVLNVNRKNIEKNDFNKSERSIRKGRKK